MPNVDVTLAVTTAMKFLRSVMLDDRSKAALLEEVELSEDGSEWLVTISVPTPRMDGLAAALGGTGVEQRDYRQVRINAANAQPISMKIRKV
jgi:hypothetical protein